MHVRRIGSKILFFEKFHYGSLPAGLGSWRIKLGSCRGIASTVAIVKYRHVAVYLTATKFGITRQLHDLYTLDSDIEIPLCEPRPSSCTRVYALNNKLLIKQSIRWITTIKVHCGIGRCSPMFPDYGLDMLVA